LISGCEVEEGIQELSQIVIGSRQFTSFKIVYVTNKTMLIHKNTSKVIKILPSVRVPVLAR
jgi:hypothetical protein